MLLYRVQFRALARMDGFPGRCLDVAWALRKLGIEVGGLWMPGSSLNKHENQWALMGRCLDFTRALHKLGVEVAARHCTVCVH